MSEERSQKSSNPSLRTMDLLLISFFISFMILISPIMIQADRCVVRGVGAVFMNYLGKLYLPLSDKKKIIKIKKIRTHARRSNF